jgi:methylated-DNA-[protein]-cysteine S-methyltransferase
MYASLINTPIGKIIIEADDAAVFFIGFKEDDITENPNTISSIARDQLEQYFSGKGYAFNFPIRQNGTEFQQRVWNELLNVSPGKPISYTALSKRMNNPLAIRAIAAANGKNNLMIVVPCHRIIGANGDLVGYAGGLWRKKWLLEHEAKMTGLGQAILF